MRAVASSGNSSTPDHLFESLLSHRSSCRAFLSDPIPQPLIERILVLAQRTASWCNAQPWQVSIFSPRATDALRNELLQYVQHHQPCPDLTWPESYPGVYLERRRASGFQLYEAAGVDRNDKAAAERQRIENFRFFGAPHVAIISTQKELGVYGAVDCGAYVSNFCLAARSLKIDSIPQAALAAYPEFWRARLNLGPDRLIVCGIAFGYGDQAAPANQYRTARANISEVAHWIDT